MNGNLLGKNSWAFILVGSRRYLDIELQKFVLFFSVFISRHVDMMSLYLAFNLTDKTLVCV